MPIVLYAIVWKVILEFLNQCLKTLLGEFDDPSRSLFVNLLCLAVYALLIWLIMACARNLWRHVVSLFQVWVLKSKSDAYFIILLRLYKDFNGGLLSLLDRGLVLMLSYALKVHFEEVAVKRGIAGNQFGHVFDIWRRIVAGIREGGVDSVRTYIAVCVQVNNEECGIDWTGFDAQKGGLFSDGFASVYSALLEVSERDKDVIKIYAQEVNNLLSDKKGLAPLGAAIKKLGAIDFDVFSTAAKRLPEYISRHMEYAKRRCNIEVMAAWASALQSADRYLTLVQEHGQRTVGLEDRLKELCDKMNTAGAYTYALRVKIGAVLAQAAAKTEILTRQADVSNVKKE